MDLLPVTLEWISELRWLDKPPLVVRQFKAHQQVSLMEVALEFEAYAGRPLL